MKKQVEYLQRLFYDIWNDFGKVYLLVGYSENTIIGKRGFTEEEKKQGIVLVFNNKTNEKMEWDKDGNVSCVLAFGSRREDIFIHHDDLRAVFSTDAGIQFVRSDMAGEREPEPAREPGPGQDDSGAGSPQVVSLSKFRKRKSKK